MGYLCDSEDGNAGVLLITNLADGASLSPCPECAPIILGGLLEGMTGVKWAPVADTATEPGPDDERDDDEHQDHGEQPQPEPGAEPAPVVPDGPVPDSDHDPEDTTEAQVRAGLGLVIDGGEDDGRGWSDETIAAALGDEADQLAADPR